MIPFLDFKNGGWCGALNRSYAPGRYQPKTREEYDALAPFAENAQKMPPAESATRIDVATAGKEALMSYAKELGLSPAYNIGAENLRAMVIKKLAEQGG